ncbi:hypothetical protein ACQUFY_05765 [Robbsia andropogonis]
MTHYAILRADFSVWKRLKYLALAQEAVRRDIGQANPVLHIVEVAV